MIHATLAKTVALTDAAAEQVKHRPWTALSLVAVLVGAGVTGASFTYGDQTVSFKLMGQAEQGKQIQEIVTAVRAAALAECRP